MISVSIQYSMGFGLLHMALPPMQTTDFDKALTWAKQYMLQHAPLAHNVSYHLMRNDWQYRNELTVQQISVHLN